MRSGTLGSALEVVAGRKAATVTAAIRMPSWLRRFMGFPLAEPTRGLLEPPHRSESDVRAADDQAARLELLHARERRRRLAAGELGERGAHHLGLEALSLFFGLPDLDHLEAVGRRPA